ncbi:MAG: hypothetical protein ACLUD2_14750 [Clostridium sp.]
MFCYAELGAPDASGRRSPVDTGRTEEYPADTIIAAIGEIHRHQPVRRAWRRDGCKESRPVVDASVMTTEAGVCDGRFQKRTGYRC